MPFSLSRGSLNELNGVHPDLVRVVRRAIGISSQDFAVHDGIRSTAEQRENVRRGVSQTMDSKHLKQSDGQGHAVDLVPVINGQLRWEWRAIYPIARAMRQAAEQEGVRIRWGGNWSRLDGTTADPERLVTAYVDSRRRQGRRAFIDGPHYELV